MINLGKAIELFDHLRIETSNTILSRSRLQELLERVEALILKVFDDLELERYLNTCKEIDRMVSSNSFDDIKEARRKLLSLLDIVIDVLELSKVDFPNETSLNKPASQLHDNSKMMLVNPLWKGRNFEKICAFCLCLFLNHGQMLFGQLSRKS